MDAVDFWFACERGGESDMPVIWASVGTGVMAMALIRGAVSQGSLKPSEIILADCDAQRLAPFSLEGFLTTTDNAAAVREASYILLGVRPHQAHDAVRGFAGEMEGKTLVSICAGVTIASLKALLPEGANTARVMPNLPATVGAGVTALAAPEAGPRTRDDLKAFFSCSGELAELDEALLDAVTAVSGSGPGYFFKIASAMQSEAERMGLPPDMARRMIAGTMKGAARMLGEPDADAADLASHVAVPNGTTEAAFQVMDRYELDTAIAHAMRRCSERAGELAR